jgi:N,N-dimethylformamidase
MGMSLFCGPGNGTGEFQVTTRTGDSTRIRTIVGYCWPWTARAGEHIEFKVSATERNLLYRADLVRIVCADSLSDQDLFKEVELRATFSGEYSGRHQPIHPGSYIEIPSTNALNKLESFTVQTLVMPTLLPGGTRVRFGGHPFSVEVPRWHEQHLVSRWDHRRRHGWSLLLDDAGRPSFVCGDGNAEHRTTLDHALLQDHWFLVVGSFDALDRRISIHARRVPVVGASADEWAESCVSQIPGNIHIVHQHVLRFAACTDGPGNGQRLKPNGCFNGRLDRVRLSAGVLSNAEAFSLIASDIPELPSAPLVGHWDFSLGIDSLEIRDLSKNGLHGVTVNIPTRAVAGVDWDNSVTDWRHRPTHYSAIHFHEDDLYDAEWTSDFGYTIPEDLPSGIYAARLRCGAFEDYIPFFVAPPKGTAFAKTALLIPTATYTAYTNALMFTGIRRLREIQDDRGERRIIEEDPGSGVLEDAADAEYLIKNIRTLGKGLYANHADGTLFSVASQKHTDLTIKPRGIQWTLVADSLITDWLEKAGIRYDVITDDLLHQEGEDLLSRYRVLITGNHPEYWSKPMLDAIHQYKAHGGRLMYLGGNGFFWVTSFHAAMPGAIEVRKDSFYGGRPKPFEMRHAFDGVQGGLWQNNGRPPQSLVGIGFDSATGQAFEGSAPYRRLADSYADRAQFIFEGVHNEVFGDYGVLGGGAAGQEMDSVNAELGIPPHALHLARASEFPSWVSMLDREYRLTASPPLSDVIFFETSSGGAVFSAGSMAWVGSLSSDGYNNDVARITENVLRRFLQPAPFQFPGLHRK